MQPEKSRDCQRGDSRKEIRPSLLNSPMYSARHGLDITVSPELFADYFMERPDTRQDNGEDRWVALGMIRGMVVVPVYTERDGNTQADFSAQGNRPGTEHI